MWLLIHATGIDRQFQESIRQRKMLSNYTDYFLDIFHCHFKIIMKYTGYFLDVLQRQCKVTINYAAYFVDIFVILNIQMVISYSEYVLGIVSSLTHWGRDKMAAISQTTLSNAFSWMKMYELRLRIRWSFFPNVRISNIPAFVQIMAWHRPGDKPLSEPMMVRLPTHICVTRPQWVNII